jgi:hypothetical protein
MDLFFRDKGSFGFEPRILYWFWADKTQAMTTESGTWHRGSFVGAELRRATMLEF